MTVQFTAGEVIQATKGRRIATGMSESFAGVSTDTRNLFSGALFVALSGERFDGHDFVEEAVRRGAAGLVVSRPLSCPLAGISVFLVPDTLAAYQDLARFHRCRFRLPVIAVTGSNGKTSTKDMIAAVLSMKKNVLKTENNFNNEIGLSQTLLKIRESHEAVVVEMGMRGLGEIAALSAVALPTVGVVTNVGETHLERLGNIENIAAAKAELIEALNYEGIAVLNGDDPRVRAMAAKTPARTVFYGLGLGMSVKAVCLAHSSQGVSFTCEAGGRSFPVFIPVPGIHNVYNALAAIATGLEQGMEPQIIADGLAKFEPGKMRLNIRNRNGITVIDDTYNASPLSMTAAIGVLASVARERKIAAIGDMLELGSAARDAHVKVGEELAAIGANVVLTIGEFARAAGEAAMAKGVPVVFSCTTHEEALQRMRECLRTGDTLLVKGSRGMTMEKLLSVFDTLPEE